MRTIAVTIGLLAVSNVFMTIAWYAHLKNLSSKPWYVAALISWGVALFEYLVQVPANRIGYTQLSLAQLKILQEVITLCVFAPFALFLHEAAAEPELRLGGALPRWRGLLHLSLIFLVIRNIWACVLPCELHGWPVLL